MAADLDEVEFGRCADQGAEACRLGQTTDQNPYRQPFDLPRVYAWNVGYSYEAAVIRRDREEAPVG